MLQQSEFAMEIHQASSMKSDEHDWLLMTIDSQKLSQEWTQLLDALLTTGGCPQRILHYDPRNP